MNWRYVPEKLTNNKIDHLWYIDMDFESEPNFEAEIYRHHNGPFIVSLYEKDENRSQIKFKTLPAAKKKIRTWLSKKMIDESKRISALASDLLHLEDGDE